VAPLYGSVDPEAHCRVMADERFACDLSYLGTWAADRQPAVEELFIAPARRRPERRFLIGGAQYPADFPWAKNIFFAQHVEPGQHPAFYSSSRLTLNVTRRAMKEMGFCPSGRLFEAAACGTPLLTDEWPGLALFLEPGTEIMVARNTDEAVAAMDLPDDELARIAARARERVLDEHTAAHRARHLETILDNTTRAAEEAELAVVRRSVDLVEA
jgi:spore maturation protein CgeB